MSIDNNNSYDEEVDFGNTIEDLNSKSIVDDFKESDIPDVDVTTSRKSASARRLKIAALGILGMLIALVAMGITFNRYTDAKQANKAEEAAQAVANQQKVSTNSSRVDFDKDMLAADQGMYPLGLPVPAGAIEPTANGVEALTAESLAAQYPSSPTPIMMPEPTAPPIFTPSQRQAPVLTGIFDDDPPVRNNPSAAPSGFTPPPDFSSATAPPLTPQQTRKQRLLASGVMAYENAGRTAVSGGNAPSGNNQNKMLSGTVIANGTATKRGDTSFLLAKGTAIPCVLRNRISSDYTGFTTCQISKDVYSANGKTLLIERGSKVFGEQNIEIKQGQSSVYVLWTSVETPKGITVNLESPAAGQLGETGIKAKVNNNFWKRFGGAIMLSLIDDAISATASRVEGKEGGENNTTVSSTTNTAQSMAEKALDSTVNIPPTATVPQGTVMSILVVRDVDFGSVYGIGR